jgi:leucyl-tRNA synthetase
MTTTTSASGNDSGRGDERATPYRYDRFRADEIERKWQKIWDERGTFVTPNPGAAGFDAKKPKFYCLDMFPYPSGAGLHVGHPEGYTATDIVSRFMRMRGFNVLHPMGYDAFGLPAEQYAIQTGVHPAQTTKAAITEFRRQLKRFGFSYDWTREVATIDPEYYKWTQWIFLRLYDSWFDPQAQSPAYPDGRRHRGAARPIADLIAQLESGDIRVGLDGELVHIGQAAGLGALAGEPAGTRRWHELSDDERREVVDGQRLAYIGEITVNWCPALGTVLANDEVVDGKSERGGHPVKRLPLKQWQLRITAYAERLLEDLGLLDWPDATKAMQSEWIGRSEGAEIEFDVAGIGHQASGTGEDRLRVFTTRPDTLFGATYMVVAPEHELVERVLRDPAPETDVARLKAYVDAARNKSDVDRQAESKDKTGVFTGVYAVNPATGAKIPVWTADYVLMGYGTGAIMAVPAHDPRDFAFQQKYRLPWRQVVRALNPVQAVPAFELNLTPYSIRIHSPQDPWNFGCSSTMSDGDLVTSAQWLRQAEAQSYINAVLGGGGVTIINTTSAQEPCFAGEGVATNSASSEVSLDELPTREAKRTIIAWLEKSGRGTRRVNYRLRDWTFSRQRYWGEPFPIVYDERGHAAAVGESALPVKLPALADYSPSTGDEPTPTLAKAAAWVDTTAEAAGVPAGGKASVRRETNTMPGSAGSSWYFLRYCDPTNAARFVSREAEAYWMGSGHASGTQAGGVDLYIGGSEHAVGHLLYARMWQKVLFDLGEVSRPEPFQRLFHQGMITSFAYQRADKTLVAVDQVDLWEADPDERAKLPEVLDGSDDTLINLPKEIRITHLRLQPGALPARVRTSTHQKLLVWQARALKESGSFYFVREHLESKLTPIVAKMSKSLKNVVNPDEIIAEFGADTFRLYEMYMGPLEASKPWNTKDTVGLYRFLQRAWRLAVDEGTGAIKLAATPDDKIERQLHRLIAKAEQDIPRLSLNTSIAAMIEFVNLASAGGATGTLTKSQLECFALVLAPFAPHIAEELWEKTGHAESLAFAPWPTFDPKMLVDDSVEIPVSVNGKVKERITVPAGLDKAGLEKLALADAKVVALLGGKPPSKVIAVPGKMVNLVVQ